MCLSIAIIHSIIRICIIFVTSMLIVRLQEWNMWANAENVCRTEECIKLGESFYSTLNPHVNPCDDFYDYVCHGWKKRNPRPLNMESWNTEISMRQRALNNMKKILEEDKCYDVEDEMLARRIYQKCLKLPYFPEFKSDYIQKVMKRVGSWPMFLSPDANMSDFVWWRIDNYYIKLSGESALFDIKLVSTNRRNIIVQFRPLESAYGSLWRSLPWSEEEKGQYRLYLYDIIESVSLNEGSLRKTIINDLKDVLHFREQLSSILQTERNVKTPKIYSLVTIKEFQTWYDAITKNDNNLRINWLHQVRAVLKNDVESMITDEDFISVRKRYFMQLADLMESANARTIANHIHLYFAERHISLTSAMKQALRKSLYFFHGEFRTKLTRIQDCIENHSMKTVIAKLYVKVHFPKEIKAAAQNLMDALKRKAMQQIARADWLDPETKRKSIKKAKYMKTVIGYPDWYDVDVPMSEKKGIYLHPMIPDAHYRLKQNYLGMTAASLQLPFFGKDLPYVINFGAAGSILGHEVYHAFDEEGIRYDMSGLSPGWSQRMIEKHKKQMQCFEERLQRFKNDEYHKFRLQPKPTDESTLDEDLADAMGLKLAYEVYQEKLRESRGNCSVLPNFESYNCDHLFFIAFANTYCSASKFYIDQRVVVSDCHSTDAMRVNSVVSNMKEFSSAFNCKPRNYLWEEKTCDLWKAFEGD